MRSAAFRVIESVDALDAIDLPYPLFVKPLAEGSSMGVRATSLVRAPAQLRSEVARCLGQYRQPVLVETFLSGAEATVAVQGCGAAARVLGAMGIEPADGQVEHFVYGLESKRNYKALVRYHVPPRLPADQLADAQAVALGAYRVLGCRDLARVDIRFDAAGRAHFIEINPLPGLNPVTGDICLIANGIGMSYAALIEGVVESAIGRCPALQ
jgi:D-alanine-D-alanine ligase